uniref:Secreted protein n=1 Tax=Anopheles coluzzii TaxID=1518534 RepID=A0A8W7P303_ANOCL
MRMDGMQQMIGMLPARFTPPRCLLWPMMLMMVGQAKFMWSMSATESSVTALHRARNIRTSGSRLAPPQTTMAAHFLHQSPFDIYNPEALRIRKSCRYWYCGGALLPCCFEHYAALLRLLLLLLLLCGDERHNAWPQFGGLSSVPLLFRFTIVKPNLQFHSLTDRSTDGWDGQYREEDESGAGSAHINV